jgi:hypothetical protein
MNYDNFILVPYCDASRFYEYPLRKAQSNGEAKDHGDLRAEHDQQQSCETRQEAKDLGKRKSGKCRVTKDRSVTREPLSAHKRKNNPELGIRAHQARV